MTPKARKAKTEALLKKKRIPFLASLPPIESEAETRPRSAEEVGVRIVCLFCVVGSAFERGNSVYKEYLREHGLWQQLTPAELAFLSKALPSRKSLVNFTWRSEALFVLMWSAHLFDVLPLPNQETDTSQIVSKFPGLDKPPLPFIRRLRLRRKAELLDASDLIYRLHWATREAVLRSKKPPAGLIPAVIQEWHHAINWITRYGDENWDDVATDT